MNCSEYRPEESHGPTEYVTVNLDYVMTLERIRSEHDLLVNLLWHDVCGLAPNGEDLEIEPVMAQWFLKTYRGFEYSVHVDKLKEKKKHDRE